jgi:hypothetical protein
MSACGMQELLTQICVVCKYMLNAGVLGAQKLGVVPSLVLCLDNIISSMFRYKTNWGRL